MRHASHLSSRLKTVEPAALERVVLDVAAAALLLAVFLRGAELRRQRRIASATASLTAVTPTACPSAINSACSRVAVSRCFPPVHWADSVSSAWTRAPTLSQTGRERGVASAFRTGAAWAMYLPTVIRDSPSSPVREAPFRVRPPAVPPKFTRPFAVRTPQTRHHSRSGGNPEIVFPPFRESRWGRQLHREGVWKWPFPGASKRSSAESRGGHYSTGEEVIADALRLMQVRDQVVAIKRDPLKDALERGCSAVSAGRVLPFETEDEIDTFSPTCEASGPHQERAGGSRLDSPLRRLVTASRLDDRVGRERRSRQVNREDTAFVRDTVRMDPAVVGFGTPSAERETKTHAGSIRRTLLERTK